MMVRSGDALRSATATALVAIFLLSTVPFPGAAHYWHGGIEVPPPNAGMEIFFEENYANETILFGSEPTERLAGHHEWRRTINATHTTEYEWTDRDGNRSLHVFDREDAFDLQTGSSLGHGSAFTEQYPFLLPDGRFDDVLTLQLDYESLWTHAIGPHPLLPESVLWGRSFGSYDAWDLALYSRQCATMAGHVEASSTWDGEAYSDLVAVVTTSCTRDHDFGPDSVEVRWVLAFGDEPAALATERNLTITYTYGSETYVKTEEVPGQVLQNGTFPLPFEGRSDKRFFAPRDNTLTYRPYDGLFPTDPDPHPVFDIRQAGAEAVRLDDEDVRLFFASAEDPRLWRADMRRWDAGHVDWSFHFLDEGDQSLIVHLMGVKVPDGPLVVLDRDASRGSYGSYWPIPVPAETAAPGDLARTVDQMLDARGHSAYRYGWETEWWSGSAQFSAAFDDAAPGAAGYPKSGFVRTDAGTGIVARHSSSDLSFRINLQNLR